MSRHGFPKGFTLMEVLIVIVIATILASIAALSIAEYSRRAALKNAARTIETDLTNARTTARVRQQRVRIDFSAAGYTAYIDNNADSIFNAGDVAILTGVYSGDVAVAGVAPFILPGGNITFTTTGNIATQVEMILNLPTIPANVYRIRVLTTGIIQVDRSETGILGPWSRAW